MNSQLETSPALEEISQMEAADIDTIMQMYRKVAITKENYLERLSEGARSFRNRGGMFLIQNEDVLTRLLYEPGEQVRLARCGEAFCGILWYGNWCEEAFRGLETFPESGYNDDILLRLAAQGELGYAKEIIVTKSAPGGVTALKLFLDMMQFFCRIGKLYVVGEVYRVEEYEDERGKHPCDMLNMPSFSTLLKSGGIHIGQTPIRHVEWDGIRVVIRPQIILWNTAESAKVLQNVLFGTGEIR